MVERIDRAVELIDDPAKHGGHHLSRLTVAEPVGHVAGQRIRRPVRDDREFQQHLKVVIGMPGVLIAGGQVSPAELAAPFGDALGFAGDPDPGPAASRLHKDLAAAGRQRVGQRGVAVARIDAVVRPAIDVERRLGLVTPDQITRPPGPLGDR